MLGTELGVRLPAGSGQLEKADVQGASKRASVSAQAKAAGTKALEGAIPGGTAGGNSYSCPPNSHTQ